MPKDAWFDNAKMGVAMFFGTKIEGNLQFNGAKIEIDANFCAATIEGDIFFNGATIKENASFEMARIEGDIHFSFANINSLILGNPRNLKRFAKFKSLQAGENACREARKIQENRGNHGLADDYFYREMEAKRKQKHLTFSLESLLIRKLKLEKLLDKHIGFLEKQRRIYWGFLELPVQYIFGYGVYPWRVIATWLLTVFCLAFVYWLGNGVEAADSLVEYIYFSVVTAATPGYGGYHPKPGFYQGLASFEAIFGTFMWAAFIATFARKYMR